MQIGAEGLGGAGIRWSARVRAVVMAGALGLLLSGCSSSYNPVNWFGSDAPKPQQIALPDEPTADRGDLPQGLSADSGHGYAEGGRSDVTVVRPLRNAPPPKVTVGAQPGAPAAAPVAPVERTAPQPAPSAVASASDVPSDAPGAPRMLGDPNSASKAPASGKKAKAEAMQGLESFSPENYSLSYLAATVPFGHGSAHLSSADLAALRGIAAEYKKTGGAVTVVGHASSRTGDMSAVSHKIANFDISARRAESVALALAKLGVPARAIYVGAVADAEPVYQEVMPSGEAYNRRTEIFLNH
ncbi:OmpA family protein [Oleispirillum naphthae]|uniref:OmpA family protein n=1 Tax=Oleispirillum naphthae TaxID=2838853 RepID=UPI0030823572